MQIKIDPIKKSLFLILSILFLYSCGGDDTYQDTDTQEPTSPSNLVVTTITETSITISWSAATDNTQVVGYKIYQDDTEIETVTSGTQTTINGLESGVEYRYFVTAFDAENNESSPSNTLTVATAIAFKQSLQEMGFFSGNLNFLIPAQGVVLYDLNSRLFTDYAHKQRLLKLPEGKILEYNNSNLLPIFPNNTMIAKTFYYYNDETNPNLGKKIIETRVLIKVNGEWKLGNYIWNEAQTEATLSEDFEVKPISYIDANGTTQNINYEIPSHDNCITCHNTNNVINPIGPKLRNLNFNPQNGTININQLQYFINNNILKGLTNPNDVSVLPDWTDADTYTIFERGRACIEINCAHCHQPGGIVPPGFLLDFRLETPFETTGIYSHRGQIEDRIQSTVPTYRMPQLGRTIVHNEGVAMMLEYLQAIED